MEDNNFSYGIFALIATNYSYSKNVLSGLKGRILRNFDIAQIEINT